MPVTIDDESTAIAGAMAETLGVTPGMCVDLGERLQGARLPDSREAATNATIQAIFVTLQPREVSLASQRRNPNDFVDRVQAEIRRRVQPGPVARLFRSLFPNAGG